MQLIGLTLGHAFRLVAATVVVGTVALAGWPAQAVASPTGRPPGPSAARFTYSVGPISDVSVGCPGTGDISEAVDPTRGYVYQEFEGCDGGDGLGFVRSTTGGDSYTPPTALPDSRGGWDPGLAVAPDGTLYAAFMDTIGLRTYPIIEVSHDYGRTFAVQRSLRPTQAHRNWGDADYIVVGSNGTLYVAWD